MKFFFLNFDRDGADVSYKQELDTVCGYTFALNIYTLEISPLFSTIIRIGQSEGLYLNPELLKLNLLPIKWARPSKLCTKIDQ